MTWEELCKKAKKMGYHIEFDKIYDILITFFEDGSIYVEGSFLSSKRTYSQMYKIMEALK